MQLQIVAGGPGSGGRNWSTRRHAATYIWPRSSSPPPGVLAFPRTGERKTRLLQRLKSLARELTGQENVERVTVYKAVLILPAGGYAERDGILGPGA